MGEVCKDSIRVHLFLQMIIADLGFLHFTLALRFFHLTVYSGFVNEIQDIKQCKRSEKRD